MQTRIHNRLGEVRRKRGAGASELARVAGISRQTIHAIEAGSYVPNTEVALKLARALEVPVEELFALEAEKPGKREALAAEVLTAIPLAKGQALRVCQIGDRLLSVPVDAAPYYLPEADGVLAAPVRPTGKAKLTVFAKDEGHQKKLIVAGCDPATGLLSRMVEKVSGVEMIPAAASSRLALGWLGEGKVHVAGSHLEDPESGEFNLPFLRREFAGEDFAVISFARWEEGWVTAPGNPLKIRTVEQLMGRKVRFVNREPGSGSRALLERLMEESGVPAKKICGFERIAYGHLAAAYRVLGGEADVCLATRPAALAFGLEFVPLRSERYDFVMRRELLDMPAGQAFADVLQRASLRRKLEVLAGYDTAQTGAVLG